MKVFGFIFARGGSKGVPNKNIRELCGKPLIAHAIEAGMKTRRFERIVVSTDSEIIADTARQFGAEVPFMRPPELATDTSPELLSWRHAVRYFLDRGEEFDVFASIPATAPLREPSDITRCLDVFLDGNCDVVLTCTASHSSPYFTMLTRDDNGYARILLGDGTFARRQDTPKTYDITPVAYVTSPAFILKHDRLWAGTVNAVEVSKRSAIDIDEPLDFEMAEFLMRKRDACGVES